MKLMDSFHQRPVNMQINPLLIQFRGSKSLLTPKPTHVNLLTQVKNLISSSSIWTETGQQQASFCSVSQKVHPQKCPGDPVVKNLHFHCRGYRFDPWSENQDLTCHRAWPKKKKREATLHARDSHKPLQRCLTDTVLSRAFCKPIHSHSLPLTHPLMTTIKIRQESWRTWTEAFLLS